MVEEPSQGSGSGRETIPKVRKWSGTLPEVCEWSVDAFGGLEVVGGLTRRSGSDRVTFPEVRKWSVDPYGGPEVVGGPSRRSGSGRGTFS